LINTNSKVHFSITSTFIPILSLEFYHFPHNIKTDIFRCSQYLCAISITYP
jgi:hypothetical protein